MNAREFVYEEREELAEMLVIQKRPFEIRTENEEDAAALQRVMEKIRFVKATVLTDYGLRVIPEERVCRV